jgi:hypothetical protein
MPRWNGDQPGAVLLAGVEPVQTADPSAVAAIAWTTGCASVTGKAPFWEPRRAR